MSGQRGVAKLSDILPDETSGTATMDDVAPPTPRRELASLVPSFARPLLDILEWIKAHPTETGAMVGATAAVPFTGATSLLPLAAAMGLGGVGGAGAGILTGKAYGADVPDTLPGALKSMGAHGLEQSVGAVVPPAMQKAAGLVSRTSTGMVRSAIKTTVSMLRSQSAGGTAAGLSAKADALAEYIIARKLTTPEKAQAIVQETESALQAAITRAGDPVTDAPRRAQQYLGALERSANKQSLGAEDIAAIRAKAAELLRGPMGEDIPTATVVGGKKNKPRTWDIERGTTRDLRDDVRASEALSRARADSKWANNRQYGEQKTAPREASKAVERANRDAVKAAVPEAKPILGEQSRAIQSRKVLDQMAQREGNRDTLSLSGVAGAAPALAAGRIPVLGFAAQWLRNNQLKAGIHAKSLQRALVNKDAQAAASILTRLGVTIPELPEDQP